MGNKQAERGEGSQGGGGRPGDSQLAGAQLTRGLRLTLARFATELARLLLLYISHYGLNCVCVRVSVSPSRSLLLSVCVYVLFTHFCPVCVAVELMKSGNETFVLNKQTLSRCKPACLAPTRPPSQRSPLALLLPPPPPLMACCMRM